MRKVVHLQYSTRSGGSAALRLQKELLKNNVDSNIISLIPDVIGEDRVNVLGKKANFISWVNNKIHPRVIGKTNKEFGSFSYPILGTDITKLEEVKNADIIYLHWVLFGFLNLRSIKKLATLNKPIIFFLHDMWAITGGCHYSFTCEKYKTECHNCQLFPADKKRDLSTKGFEKKLKLYSAFRNLFFIAPSKWLYDSAKQSALLQGKSITYIPNVLDKTIFKPFDKKVAKQILNISPTATVIAFGAVRIDNVYKGWSYLQKALTQLKQEMSDKEIVVLIFGAGNNQSIADAIPFQTKFVGYLLDEYSTAMAYNAADVFIAPSVAEAFGYVVFEALCCGTPVVAFNIGGIPDMIQHKVNGYLAKYRDADDLAEGIRFCLQTGIKGSMLPNLDPSLVIKGHLELFNSILVK